MGGIGALEWLGIALASTFVVLPSWRIFRKAGWPPVMSLFMIVPFVNVILVVILAFSEWPIERELKRLQAQLRKE